MFPYNPNIPAIPNLAVPAVQHHNNPANNLALPAGGPAVQAAAQLGAQFMEDGNEPESPPHQGIQMPANILHAPARRRLEGAFQMAIDEDDDLFNVPPAAAAQVPNSPDSGTSAQTAMHQHPTP